MDCLRVCAFDSPVVLLPLCSYWWVPAGRTKSEVTRLRDQLEGHNEFLSPKKERPSAECREQTLLSSFFLVYPELTFSNMWIQPTCGDFYLSFYVVPRVLMQASGYWISYQGNPAGKAGEEGSKKCKFKLSVDIWKPPWCDVTLLFRTFSGMDWIQVLSFATANSQSKNSFFVLFTRDFWRYRDWRGSRSEEGVRGGVTLATFSDWTTSTRFKVRDWAYEYDFPIPNRRL